MLEFAEDKCLGCTEGEKVTIKTDRTATTYQECEKHRSRSGSREAEVSQAVPAEVPGLGGEKNKNKAYIARKETGPSQNARVAEELEKEILDKEQGR